MHTKYISNRYIKMILFNIYYNEIILFNAQPVKPRHPFWTEAGFINTNLKNENFKYISKNVFSKHYQHY